MLPIYDCFIFADELDLLELRLKELSGVVDKFVLVEATLTFQRNPKPLHFAENAERFAAFREKIIHVAVTEAAPTLPEFDEFWSQEIFQRNAIVRGLPDGEALVLISDVDEIPRKSTVEFLRRWPGELLSPCVHLEQNLHYYYLDCISAAQPYWYRALATTRSALRDWTPNDLRLNMDAPCLRNCGWHFSYFGGAASIRRKLESYSHTEFNREDLKDLAGIHFRMGHGLDPVGRGTQCQFLESPDLPDTVNRNRKHYESLGWFRRPQSEQPRIG